MVVQRWLIGEESRQHTFDAERPSHSRQVIIASLEWIKQVTDMPGNIEQMYREVRIECGQFFYAPHLEFLVVGQRADAHRNIFAELYGQLATRILTIALCQECGMLIFCFGATLDVKRILEGNLCIDLCAIKLRDRILHRLEVEEIERITECVKESSDTRTVNVLTPFHLQTLDVSQRLFLQIVKGTFASTITFQLAVDEKTVRSLTAERATIDIKHRRLGQMTRAVGPEATMIGLVTTLRDIIAWFFLLIDEFQRTSHTSLHLVIFVVHQFLHVFDNEQLL